jgi:DNA-binding MarR family transcriptional regulator
VKSVLVVAVALRCVCVGGLVLRRPAGLTPRQYQALLAIKGSAQQERLTVGELAEQLQIVHHAAVELVDRLSAQNLVERHDSLDDRRKVFVKLSRTGSKTLDKLAAAHRGELRRLSPGLLFLLENLISDGAAKRDLRK